MTEWATFLAMLLGAGVAMAISLLVEARRDHRELGREARRHTYDVTCGRRRTRPQLRLPRFSTRAREPTDSSSSARRARPSAAAPSAGSGARLVPKAALTFKERDGRTVWVFDRKSFDFLGSADEALLDVGVADKAGETPAA
jgi:hypothetical protein